MSDERRQTGWVFWVTAGFATLVLSLSTYAGAYRATVWPMSLGCGFSGNTYPWYVWGRERELLPCQDAWEAFFAPANAIDRWVRPSAWPSWGFESEDDTTTE